MNEVVEFVFFVNGIWFVWIDVNIITGWCIVGLDIGECLQLIENFESTHVFIELRMNMNSPQIILLADHSDISANIRHCAVFVQCLGERQPIWRFDRRSCPS